MYFIGIDLGGTYIKSGLIHGHAEVLRHLYAPNEIQPSA